MSTLGLWLARWAHRHTVGPALCAIRLFSVSLLSSSVLSVILLASSVATAAWPPEAADDGVYGRFRGNTDLSLKLGGLVSQSRFSGSVGASAHYYSLIGIVADYSESLVADALHSRSIAVGGELRPLFFPRWLLGYERGPAWLDLTLDSIAVGFGAIFMDTGSGLDDERGVWMSLGAGFPLFGAATGPWIEARLSRRLPDVALQSTPPHGALLVYLSWHQLVQLSSGE